MTQIDAAINALEVYWNKAEHLRTKADDSQAQEALAGLRSLKNQEPVAWLRESDLQELANCNHMHIGADSPKIWAPNDISAPSPDMGLVPVYAAPTSTDAKPVRDQIKEGYREASNQFYARIEPYRLEAKVYKEAYFKLAEQIANLKTLEPPPPLILKEFTHQNNSVQGDVTLNEKQVDTWVDEASDRYMTQTARFMYVAHAAYTAGLAKARK